MTDSAPKIRIIRWLKIVISVVFVTVFLLFTIASRTLSLDVNIGLQLARWEKTNNISLVLDGAQREELLARFKDAIRIPTVSFSETHSNTSALLHFAKLLRRGEVTA